MNVFPAQESSHSPWPSVKLEIMRELLPYDLLKLLPRYHLGIKVKFFFHITSVVV